ncbi:MAG: aldehyde ferredoxin oxidoreductase family protein [Kiritimatiellae bacterium]|nr:aldehyde ferredoxin oxidoreductase family protein [Kiritimatiellia bacterium]
MNGWTGKILHINLSDNSHRLEHPDHNTYHSLIGGKGLAGSYLEPFVTLPWNDPEMPLIFMTGPLVGTASPTSGRMCIMSRSPLTGTVGDASVGGGLGFQIKKAGLDGIVITGHSKNLCGIEIVDDQVNICPAENLAGMQTEPLYTRLKDKGSVASVGPGAENGVLFSCIMVDGNYTAGRNGLGLVSAEKNLKYLTIKGSGTIAVNNANNLKKAREDIFRLISANPLIAGEQGLMHYGTGAMYDLTNTRRMMPTANFRKTVFNMATSMNAHAYKQKYSPRRTGCKGCHILCKKVTDNGMHLPEFETMSHFSALLENDNIDIVTRANSLCNELGIDTISAGATLACYAETEERTLNGKEILSLLEDIGKGRGIGRELGQGSWRYAQSKGAPDSSITVKKQELAAYDARGAYGMALGYAVSTRGACHLRAYPLNHEILRRPVATDRFSFAGKARMIKIAEDMNSVIDSLTACKFVFFACSLEEYAKVYTAVVGEETTAHDMLALGERIYYKERIMNALNGFTQKDDDLPARFFEESGSSGNTIEIPPLNRQDFLQTRANYYKIRGLDNNGIPTKEKATELDLKWNNS